jgi:hypothetical protein
MSLKMISIFRDQKMFAAFPFSHSASYQQISERDVEWFESRRLRLFLPNEKWRIYYKGNLQSLYLYRLTISDKYVL